MILNKVHLLTVLEIWSPKYSTKHESGEWVVLLGKYKVHHASPTMIIKFTKAKHLLGQRFAIKRSAVERYPLVTNGRIDCYEVPFNMLESWISDEEALQKIEAIWPPTTS